jgi:DMSO/TMAO reductase YedYZ molybdopterin-dependent catalytic subunit
MQMTFHDQRAVTYEGVPLAAILKAVGVRTDSLHGPALATRIVAESSDGYKVVLALADLDPSLGGKRVLLADRMDGRPLPVNEAPWRLVIAGEERPSRSARQVLRIRVATENR